jgi:RNase P protein component
MAEQPKDAKNTISKPGIVFLRPISSPQRSRPMSFTLSVSKKVFKTAVLRNKVKRKIREAYRLAIKDKKNDKKHDTLLGLPPVRIDAREGAIRMTQKEMKDAISTHLQA